MLRACSHRRRTSRLALLWLTVAIALATTAQAATVVDPALRFRRLTTAHFVIYFHQGERALASRLALIAEQTWSDLRARFGWLPPDRTHVLLADQADTANGWATPLPYNTIMVTAAWPSGAEFIGHTDDWLRLVFTHEFVHIVHLDQSRGWARGVRTLFGRVPLAFPNLFLPGWQIEGLATYFESAVTGRGRQFAEDFRAVERESLRTRRVPLDRANGGLLAWPGGTAAYAYGLGFHEYLAERFGADRLVALAGHTAGRVPYTGSRVFPATFGEPLGSLWTQYQGDVRAHAVAPGSAGGAASTDVPPDGPKRLTFEAYEVTGARYLPSACAECPDEIAYSVRNPHEFPALKIIGVEGGAPRTLTTRYLGGTIGVGPARLVFDQQQLHRNVALFSDLYAVDRRDGRVRALTSGLRLQDPDVSADSRRLVATRQHDGARDLVVAELSADGSVRALSVLLSEPDTQFAAPRWSPDGRWIAVERHRRGEGAEVVTVDVDTAAVRVVATGATRAVTPAWRPDGRALIVAADEPDRPFNLFEIALAADGAPGVRRRLTDTAGGARNPDISPDGRMLLYVGYTADGFELFRRPYPDVAADRRESADSRPVAPPRDPDGLLNPAEPRRPSATSVAAGEIEDSAYRPLPTLAPRAWTPALASDGGQFLVGASAGGSDVLGYHAYAAAVQWRTLTPTTALVSDRRRPDWSATYVYDRWVPQLYARAGQTVSFLTGASALGGRAATWREQTLEGGVQVPLRRVLRSHRLLGSALRSDNTIVDVAGTRGFTRLALRGGWSYRSARFYGYSISPEHGVALGATAEFSGDRLRNLDAVTVTGDGRLYLPGIRRHHVTAVRAAAGLSSGRSDFGRVFRLGGAVSNPEPLEFGRGAMSLLRGFASDSAAGRRVAILNSDYRFPLRRVERGLGTLPLFLRQLHGATFIDVGHAWTRGAGLADVKWAVGAELSADVVAGYQLPLTVTFGVARGRDGARRLPDTTMSYVRIGRGF